MGVTTWIGLAYIVLLISLVVYAIRRDPHKLHEHGGHDHEHEDHHEHPSGEFQAKARRGGGNAMMLLQEIVEPRVEHVIEAKQDQIVMDNAPTGGEGEGDSEERTIRADLANSLARDPIDPEDIRRALETARRAGFDWKVLYDEAARAEIAARPYRASALPPAGRVSPRD